MRVSRRIGTGATLLTTSLFGTLAAVPATGGASILAHALALHVPNDGLAVQGRP